MLGALLVQEAKEAAAIITSREGFRGLVEKTLLKAFIKTINSKISKRKVNRVIDKVLTAHNNSNSNSNSNNKENIIIQELKMARNITPSLEHLKKTLKSFSGKSKMSLKRTTRTFIMAHKTNGVRRPLLIRITKRNRIKNISNISNSNNSNKSIIKINSKIKILRLLLKNGLRRIIKTKSLSPNRWQVAF